MSQDYPADEEMEMAPGQAAQVAAVVNPPPAPPEPDIDVLDMDQVLAFTQKKRMRVVNSINKNLANIEDPAMISAMLKGLSDMDKAVVQRKRVGIEEEVAKTAEESARDAAGILRAITSQAFQVPAGESTRTAPPTFDDSHLPPVKLVEGELDQGRHEMSYDSFAAGIAGQPR